MVVEAFILCYNEEKMIWHTLNYYTKFCEQITVYDNESTDYSINIIREHFPRVRIESFSSGGEYREDLQIWHRNNCWKNSRADYVIICDMDELLYSQDIQRNLDSLKNTDVAIPIITGYNMIYETFPNSYDAPITEQVKIGFRERFFDKASYSIQASLREINCGPGSRFCDPVLNAENRVDCLVDFKLLHYKYMGKEYLYHRHKNYADRMSEINKQHGFGCEYMNRIAPNPEDFDHPNHSKIGVISEGSKPDL